MSKRKTPGLILRGNVWHIQKVVKGVGRLRESTGEREIERAEAYLARRLAEIERQAIHGVRPVRSFREAAIKYLNEAEKKSLSRDAASLALLEPYIGGLPIDQTHMGTLEPFIKDRKAAGKSAGTINRDLAVVRNILNLAARLWRDGFGQTWLESAPMILPVKGPKRKPYPLSWEEQGRLFKLLPEYLANMALFAVNTGCREQEICQLRWEWEERIAALGTSVFILPEWIVKGQEGKTVERIVPLNKVAKSVIEGQRGGHPEWVFPHKGKPLDRMNNRAWRAARKEAGLEQVRVHDLRHTFGRRLRATEVSLEDRQDLLGHVSGRITTHYSTAEIRNLIDAVEKLCERDRAPELTLINLSRRKPCTEYDTLSN
jgi:integrase